MQKQNDKIQLFLIRTLNEFKIERNFLNLIKSFYEKYTADIRLNGEGVNALVSMIKNNWTRMSTLTTSI